MKIIIATLLAIASTMAIAQPSEDKTLHILKCDLDHSYHRDFVLEAKNSYSLKDTTVAIKQQTWGTTITFEIKGPEYRSYVSIHKGLDKNGFGNKGTYSNDQRMLKVFTLNYQYSKLDGSTSFELNKETGSFKLITSTKNPIGNGDITIHTSGTCRTAKAAIQ